MWLLSINLLIRLLVLISSFQKSVSYYSDLRSIYHHNHKLSSSYSNPSPSSYSLSFNPLLSSSIECIGEDHEGRIIIRNEHNQYYQQSFDQNANQTLSQWQEIHMTDIHPSFLFPNYSQLLDIYDHLFTSSTENNLLYSIHPLGYLIQERFSDNLTLSSQNYFTKQDFFQFLFSHKLTNLQSIVITQEMDILLLYPDLSFIQYLNHTSGLLTRLVGHINQPGYQTNHIYGSQSFLGQPIAIQINSQQQLFVLDQQYHILYQCNLKAIPFNGLQPQEMMVIAGNNSFGYSGDYQHPSHALFHSPSSLWIDIYDNIYIADTGNHVIRMIEQSSMTIITLLGLKHSHVTPISNINNINIPNPTQIWGKRNHDLLIASSYVTSPSSSKPQEKGLRKEILSHKDSLELNSFIDESKSFSQDSSIYQLSFSSLIHSLDIYVPPIVAPPPPPLIVLTDSPTFAPTNAPTCQTKTATLTIIPNFDTSFSYLYIQLPQPYLSPTVNFTNNYTRYQAFELFSCQEEIILPHQNNQSCVLKYAQLQCYWLVPGYYLFMNFTDHREILNPYCLSDLSYISLNTTNQSMNSFYQSYLQQIPTTNLCPTITLTVTTGMINYQGITLPSTIDYSAKPTLSCVITPSLSLSPANSFYSKLSSCQPLSLDCSQSSFGSFVYFISSYNLSINGHIISQPYTSIDTTSILKTWTRSFNFMLPFTIPRSTWYEPLNSRYHLYFSFCNGFHQCVESPLQMTIDTTNDTTSDITIVSQSDLSQNISRSNELLLSFQITNYLCDAISGQPILNSLLDISMYTITWTMYALYPISLTKYNTLSETIRFANVTSTGSYDYYQLMDLTSNITNLSQDPSIFILNPNTIPPSSVTKTRFYLIRMTLFTSVSFFQTIDYSITLNEDPLSLLLSPSSSIEYYLTYNQSLFINGSASFDPNIEEQQGNYQFYWFCSNDSSLSSEQLFKNISLKTIEIQHLDYLCPLSLTYKTLSMNKPEKHMNNSQININYSYNQSYLHTYFPYLFTQIPEKSYYTISLYALLISNMSSMHISTVSDDNSYRYAWKQYTIHMILNETSPYYNITSVLPSKLIDSTSITSNQNKLNIQESLQIQYGIYSSYLTKYEISLINTQTSQNQLFLQSFNQSYHLLPTTINQQQILPNQINYFSFILSPNTLLPGMTYTFQLLVNHLPWSFDIVTNINPSSGQLTISPTRGKAFVDNFKITTSNWMDVDLPLSYQYYRLIPKYSNNNQTMLWNQNTSLSQIKQLQSNQSYEQMILLTKSSLTSFSTIFPSLIYTIDNLNNEIIPILTNETNHKDYQMIIVSVYDNLNAFTEISHMIELISSANISLFQVIDMLSIETIDNIPLQNMWITLYTSILQEQHVFCFEDQGIDNYCQETFHREACSSLANVCGPCLVTHPYTLSSEDSILDANSLCSMTPFLATTTSPQLKTCLNNCSFHGQCISYDTITLLSPYPEVCLSNNSYCNVRCHCDLNYYDEQCSLSQSQFVLQTNYTQTLFSLISKNIINSLTIDSTTNINVITNYLQQIVTLFPVTTNIQGLTTQTTLINAQNLLEMMLTLVTTGFPNNNDNNNDNSILSSLGLSLIQTSTLYNKQFITVLNNIFTTIEPFNLTTKQLQEQNEQFLVRISILNQINQIFTQYFNYLSYQNHFYQSQTTNNLEINSLTTTELSSSYHLTINSTLQLYQQTLIYSHFRLVSVEYVVYYDVTTETLQVPIEMITIPQTPQERYNNVSSTTLLPIYNMEFIESYNYVPIVCQIIEINANYWFNSPINSIPTSYNKDNSNNIVNNTEKIAETNTSSSYLFDDNAFYNRSNYGYLISSIYSIQTQNIEEIVMSIPLLPQTSVLNTHPSQNISNDLWNFSTNCLVGDSTIYTYQCPYSNYTIYHTCPGTMTKNYTSQCPQPQYQCVLMNMTTQEIDYENSKKYCTSIWSMSQQKMICSCQIVAYTQAIASSSSSSSSAALNHRQLQSSINGKTGNKQIDAFNEQSGLLTMSVMTVYIAEEFIQTFSVAKDFSSDPSNLLQVLSVLIMYIVLWGCGFGIMIWFYIHIHGIQSLCMLLFHSLTCSLFVQPKVFMETNGNHLNENKVEIISENNKQTNNTKPPQQLEEVQIMIELHNYIKTIIPSIFNPDSWLIRLHHEVSRHHLYIQLFVEETYGRIPYYIMLQILTIQTALMFLLCILYDLNQPTDDGTCIHHQSKSNCLQEKSIFDASQTYCLWTNDQVESGSYCEWHEMNTTFMMGLYASVVSSVFTSLIMRPLDALFEILNSPTLPIASDVSQWEILLAWFLGKDIASLYGTNTKGRNHSNMENRGFDHQKKHSLQEMYQSKLNSTPQQPVNENTNKQTNLPNNNIEEGKSDSPDNNQTQNSKGKDLWSKYIPSITKKAQENIQSALISRGLKETNKLMNSSINTSNNISQLPQIPDKMFQRLQETMNYTTKLEMIEEYVKELTSYQEEKPLSKIHPEIIERYEIICELIIEQRKQFVQQCSLHFLQTQQNTSSTSSSSTSLYSIEKLQLFDLEYHYDICSHRPFSDSFQPKNLFVYDPKCFNSQQQSLELDAITWMEIANHTYHDTLPHLSNELIPSSKDQNNDKENKETKEKENKEEESLEYKIQLILQQQEIQLYEMLLHVLTPTTNSSNQDINNVQGIEIMEEFVKDLLGYETTSAKIYHLKEDEDYSEIDYYPNIVKWLVGWFVICINIAMIYYTLLKAYQRGYQWQQTFVLSCFFQLIIEIVFNETVECLYVHCMVPSLIVSQMHGLYHDIFIPLIVQNVQFLMQPSSSITPSPATSSSPSTLSTSPLIFSFNQCFFLSYKLAKYFPHLIESQFVSLYQTMYPHSFAMLWNHSMTSNELLSIYKQEYLELQSLPQNLIDLPTNNAKQSDSNQQTTKKKTFLLLQSMHKHGVLPASLLFSHWNSTNQTMNQSNNKSIQLITNSTLCSSLWSKLWSISSTFLTVLSFFVSIYCSFLIVQVPFELQKMFLRFSQSFVYGAIVLMMYYLLMPTNLPYLIVFLVLVCVGCVGFVYQHHSFYSLSFKRLEKNHNHQSTNTKHNETNKTNEPNDIETMLKEEIKHQMLTKQQMITFNNNSNNNSQIPSRKSFILRSSDIFTSFLTSNKTNSTTIVPAILPPINTNNLSDNNLNDQNDIVLSPTKTEIHLNEDLPQQTSPTQPQISSEAINEEEKLTNQHPMTPSLDVIVDDQLHNNSLYNLHLLSSEENNQPTNQTNINTN